MNVSFFIIFPIIFVRAGERKPTKSQDRWTPWEEKQFFTALKVCQDYNQHPRSLTVSSYFPSILGLETLSSQVPVVAFFGVVCR